MSLPTSLRRGAPTPHAPHRLRLARAARRVVAGAAVVAGLGLVSTLPAHAATDVPDAATSALVTRLTVEDGRGWLTVQVRIAATRVVGFEVHVPAGEDSWSGPADVAVPELGIHCRSVGHGSLGYLCGQSSATGDSTSYLPLGGYQVSIPVSHTGLLPTGVLGHTWVDAVDAGGVAGRYGFDPFTVVDGAHFRSTAEVRSAPVQPDPGTTLTGLATVPISVTVVPGESVASIDVTLPGSATWSLVGTNALPQGVWCSERDATSGLPILHCAGRYGAPLPTGRYELVSVLRFAGPKVDGRNTRVAMTLVGGTFEQVDICHFRFPTSV